MNCSKVRPINIWWCGQTKPVIEKILWRKLLEEGSAGCPRGGSSVIKRSETNSESHLTRSRLLMYILIISSSFIPLKGCFIPASAPNETTFCGGLVWNSGGLSLPAHQSFSSFLRKDPQELVGCSVFLALVLSNCLFVAQHRCSIANKWPSFFSECCPKSSVVNSVSWFPSASFQTPKTKRRSFVPLAERARRVFDPRYSAKRETPNIWKVSVRSLWKFDKKQGWKMKGKCKIF